MNDRVLVDTNVLVYAYDRSEPKRQRQALRVLDQLAVSGAGVISTQILAEFFVVVTRKLTIPLSIDAAHDSIKNYLRSWTVIAVTGIIVLEAARGVREHQFSFWDAQVWAAARLNQIPIIFSENFSSGAVIEGIKFVDPFSDGFQLKNWIACG